MIKLIVLCLVAVGLVGMVGCSSDTEKTTTASSTYDSSVSDSKDMHPHHHSQPAQ